MDRTVEAAQKRRQPRLVAALGVDLRSLAVFRIGVALVLLCDILSRSRDLTAHYTDAGVVPGWLLLKMRGSGVLLSLHHHAGFAFWAEAAVFALALIAATALLTGYRTRIATVVCWYLLISLQLRSPILSYEGSDKLLRILLFWSILLPLGERFSFDARRREQRGEAATSNTFLSATAVALLVQIALVYIVTGLKKSGASWHDGSAVYYALHLQGFTTRLAPYLLEQRWALPALTHGTLWLELLGPFLAFSPFKSGPLRCLTISAFVGFHVGLWFFMRLGTFPAVCIAMWMAFLPTWFWDVLLPRLRKTTPSLEQSGTPRLRQAWPVQAAAGLVLLYIVLFLANEVTIFGYHPRIPIPGAVTRAGRVLRINQHWAMFAPSPPDYDLTPSVEGTLADGRRVNPFTGFELRDGAVELAADRLPSYRWFLYYTLLTMGGSEVQPIGEVYRELGRYLCRTWNAQADEARLVSVDMAHFHQPTPAPDRAGERPPPRRVPIRAHQCGPTD